MAELEERVERLENELAMLKVSIKQVLVELKELVARDQNPLADMNAHPPQAGTRHTDNRNVILTNVMDWPCPQPVLVRGDRSFPHRLGQHPAV